MQFLSKIKEKKMQFLFNVFDMYVYSPFLLTYGYGVSTNNWRVVMMIKRMKEAQNWKSNRTKVVIS